MTSDARTAALIEEPRRNAHLAQKNEQPFPPRRWPSSPGDLHRSASPPLTFRTGSRRWFLKAGIASLGAFALWMMDRVARLTESIPENSESTLAVPWSPAQTIRFYDPMIVVNRAGGTAVFSSQCPHMGCRINRTEGQELVCPCHGSRFNLQGDVVQGPATRGLGSLPFALDRAKGVLRVILGSSQT
ncbi:MAG: Rieske (2Fe-2S) protein [Acidobacteriaceae bacterium]